MTAKTTSLYRRLRHSPFAQAWVWLRLSETEFDRLLDLIRLLHPGMRELTNSNPNGFRVFGSGDALAPLLFAEPIARSPSIFGYSEDTFTIGCTCDRHAAADIEEFIDPGALTSEAAPNSRFSDSRIFDYLLEHIANSSLAEIDRQLKYAVRPDLRLDREGPEFFEEIGRRLQMLFAPDYVELQLTTPSIYWSEQSEGWSWMQTSSDDFQWPISLSSDQERELFHSGRCRVIDEIASDSTIVLAERPGGRRLTSGLLIPLVHRGKYLGLVKLFFERSVAVTPREELLLENFRETFSLLIDRCRDHLRTQRMAMIDGLTDLYNHRFFLTQLRTEFQRSLRYHSPMTLIMIDIDDFKLYNDTYGHQAGNRVLTWVARKIRSSVRDIDFVARYGGEEFALILPEIKAKDGLIVAEKIRKAVSSEAVVTDNGEQLRPITISCGVTDNERAKRTEDLIEQADRALYWVKRHGRNLVRLAESGN